MNTSPKEFTLSNGKTVLAKQLSRTQFNRLICSVGDLPNSAKEIMAHEYTVRLALAGQKTSDVKKPLIEKHPVLGDLLASSEFDQVDPVNLKEIAVYAFAHLNPEEVEAGNSDPLPGG